MIAEARIFRFQVLAKVLSVVRLDLIPRGKHSWLPNCRSTLFDWSRYWIFINKSCQTVTGQCQRGQVCVMMPVDENRWKLRCSNRSSLPKRLRTFWPGRKEPYARLAQTRYTRILLYIFSMNSSRSFLNTIWKKKRRTNDDERSTNGTCRQPFSVERATKSWHLQHRSYSTTDATTSFSRIPAMPPSFLPSLDFRCLPGPLRLNLTAEKHLSWSCNALKCCRHCKKSAPANEH